MKKRKIKNVIIITDDDEITKEQYLWINYKNNEIDVMLYEEGIKFLHNYTFLNKFKSEEKILKMYDASQSEYFEFIRNNNNCHLINEAVSKYSDEVYCINKQYGINLNNLTNLYWLNEENYDRVMSEYEKIKSVVLEECNKEKIKYRTDSRDILQEKVDIIKKDKYASKNLFASIKEYQDLFDNEMKEAYSLTGKMAITKFNNIEETFNQIKVDIVTYSKSMYEREYQLLTVLKNPKHPRRIEILTSWAEFLIALKDLIEIINKLEEFSKIARTEKTNYNLKQQQANLSYIEDIERLIEHDPTKECYRYHATMTLEDAQSILKNGLFMGSDDLNSTSFPEFTINDILNYSYGNIFNKVGDYIIVFSEPIDTNIVRKTTQEERQKNLIISRRLCVTNSINNYVVDPKYIVGLVDKEHQKVYSIKNYKQVEESFVEEQKHR